MTIRYRVLLIVTAALLALLPMQYFALRAVFVRSLTAREAAAVTQQTAQARSALEDEFTNLNAIAADYAAWDKTYQDGTTPGPGVHQLRPCRRIVPAPPAGRRDYRGRRRPPGHGADAAAGPGPAPGSARAAPQAGRLAHAFHQHGRQPHGARGHTRRSGGDCGASRHTQRRIGSDPRRDSDGAPHGPRRGCPDRRSHPPQPAPRPPVVRSGTRDGGRRDPAVPRPHPGFDRRR